MRVILFDLDCCRPDHLSAYGYRRETSPTLARLGSEGVRFTECFASNTPCLPSRAALFSGRFGVGNGIETHCGAGRVFRYPGGDSHGHRADMPMLARHLRVHGYRTVSFSSFADRHNAWWFTAGWSELHTFTNKCGQETADEVNAAVLPWLAEHGAEDDYFVHIHYWDIHSHYRISERWARLFEGEPAPDWPDEAAIAAHQAVYGPRTARDLYTGYADEDRAPVPTMPGQVGSRADFVRLIDCYDAAIAYVDKHIGDVLDVLAELGVLEDTAFVVSGDHGDSFGECGQYMDHGLANDQVQRVPMMVRWPGLEGRGERSGLLYSLDLAPTLCELLGLPIPERWDGESFASALRGDGMWKGRDYLCCSHGIYTFQRALRRDRWLYVRNLHPGLYPYDQDEYLYDRPADPHQTKDLSSERAEVVGELSGLMDAWLVERCARAGVERAPLESMVGTGPFVYYTPERMVERLRRTGRVAEADGLIARLRRFHPGLPL